MKKIETRRATYSCSQLTKTSSLSYISWGWDFMNVQVLSCCGTEKKWTCSCGGSSDAVRSACLLDRMRPEGWSSEAPRLSAALSLALQVEGGQ